MKRWKSIILVCILLIIWNVAPVSVFAVEETETANQEQKVDTSSDYRVFLQNNADKEKPVQNITVSADQFEIKTQEQVSFQPSYEGKSNVVLLEQETGTIVCPVTVDQAGLYHIGITYRPLQDDNLKSISFDMTIGGQHQFSSMEYLTLDRPWKSTEQTRRTDLRGNQILSTQEEVLDWQTMPLNDPEGRYNDSLYFWMEAGTNTLEFKLNVGVLAIAEIMVYNEEAAPDYQSLLKEYQTLGYQQTHDQLIFVESEDYIEKSGSTILPDFDKSDTSIQPNHPSRLLYNMLPGERYQEPGQWVKWKFSVEESGLYSMTFHARQNTKSGFTSSRKLYINDQVVFDECNVISFPSSNSWYQKTLGDGNTDYQFYFEAGKEYEIKLEVIPGPFSDTTLVFDDCIYRLNSLYRSVVMIAGTNPDKYRDYKLASEIPQFRENVAEILDILYEQEQKIKAINEGKSGSELTAIRSLINRLESVQKSPDTLAKMLGSFKSDIESLSSWNMNVKQQPVDLDYIAIHSADIELPRESGGFFQQLWFELQRLVASYFDDYAVVGDQIESDRSVSVWLTLGRDQLDVFKELIDTNFNQTHNIRVDVSLVQTGIREAVLAGKAPDTVLFIASDEPVNLAIRSALIDLSKLDGFDNIKTRFQEGTMTPFEFDGGCYALPLTETFPMMFVRTDIFQELGLEIPQTWEDMYDVAAVLQRKNMDIGIPSTIGMFATLLFQNGGTFFNDDLTETAFDSAEAVEAFQTWTGFFSQYGFPVSFDFYNRFRSGEMPLGIAAYTTYTQLNSAAPEINGRWQMLPIPGIEQEDGSIDRSVSISNSAGAGTNAGLDQFMTGAVIFKDSKNVEEAWELLDWFTSDEIQTEFGQGIEAKLGPTGRYATANRNAFEKLPWTDAEKAQIKQQWSEVKLIHEIPGNYYVTRGINNAFRRVIYDYENPVDTFNRYNIQINKELERKHREFYKNK